jgi:hypothetical protein
MIKVLLVVSLFFNFIEGPHIADDLHSFAVAHNFTSDHSRTLEVRL